MAKPRGIGKAIISLRNAGRNYNQIAKELKCSKSTINYHCDKSGLTDIGFKKIKVGKKVADAIYNYCKITGNTILKASKKFELSTSTIKKYKKIVPVLIDKNK